MREKTVSEALLKIIDSMVEGHSRIVYMDEVFAWERPVSRGELVTIAGLPGGSDLSWCPRVEVGMMFYVSPVDDKADT